VFFIPLWTAFEVVYRIRARGVLSCELCGFDPYLFLTNENLARKEIESHWRKKFQEHGIPYPSDPVPEVPSETQPLDSKAPSAGPNKNV
jgi:hypothetical protein